MLPVAHSLPPNWHSSAMLLASSRIQTQRARGHKAHPQTPLGARSVREFRDLRMFKNCQPCCMTLPKTLNLGV